MLAGSTLWRVLAFFPPLLLITWLLACPGLRCVLQFRSCVCACESGAVWPKAGLSVGGCTVYIAQDLACRSWGHMLTKPA